MKAGTCAKAVPTVIMSACAACGQSGRASATVSSKPESQSTSARGRSASSDDPQAAANRLWAATPTQCGDSYYEGVLGDGICRYKQPSFPQVLPEPLTEADRENGYRWKGWAYVTGKVLRDYLKDGRWDDWRDSNTGWYTKREDVFKEAEMWNLNGHWKFRLDIKRIFEFMHTGATVDLDSPTITTEEFAGEPKVVPLRKPTCARIPGTPEHEKQQAVDKQKAVERQENETKRPNEPDRGDPGRDRPATNSPQECRAVAGHASGPGG